MDITAVTNAYMKIYGVGIVMIDSFINVNKEDIEKSISWKGQIFSSEALSLC